MEEPHRRAPSSFRTTHWSAVLAAGRGAPADARAALEELCATYWKPLYVFIRRSGADDDAARDLTQGFFASFLARDDLTRVDPSLGRFRSYLLGAVRHYLSHERERATAQKRGGGARPLSLADLERELPGAGDVADRHSPEAAFDREWALAVLRCALERLREEQEGRGHAELFELLKPALSGDEIDGGYAAVAERTAMTTVAVKVAVHRLRKRYRELVTEEIARTVDRPQDVEDELRALFTALGR